MWSIYTWQFLVIEHQTLAKILAERITQRNLRTPLRALIVQSPIFRTEFVRIADFMQVARWCTRRKDNILAVGIDLLGGDTPPEELLESILAEAPLSVQLVLFGTEALFKGHSPCSDQISLYPVKEIISMEESPLKAVRKKKDSSICVGVRLLKEKKIQALISLGNTGALMGAAKWELDPLPNVERPALLTLLPTRKNDLAVIDVGANTTCKAKYLVEHATVAVAYQKSRGITAPRVGLLNIGCESCKGTPELKETYQQLKAWEKNHPSTFSFAGNIEARDVFHGEIDVLVTDGFTGNIFLKTAEGIAAVVLEQSSSDDPNLYHSQLETSNSIAPNSKFQAAVVRQRLHYTEYPGALLCGVDGIIIKCHGNSSAQSLIRSIAIASDLIQNNFLDQIKKTLTL